MTRKKEICTCFSRQTFVLFVAVVWRISVTEGVDRPGGVLPEKLGRGVRPAYQNPYPIYDQNLRFSLPYLWPDQKFDTLFMNWLLDD